MFRLTVIQIVAEDDDKINFSEYQIYLKNYYLIRRKEEISID